MFHAAGHATDAPTHLKALLGTDAHHHQLALAYLNGAVVHQNSPWPLTATTVVFVARMLAEGLISNQELELSLLRLLRYAATSTGIAEEVDEFRATVARLTTHGSKPTPGVRPTARLGSNGPAAILSQARDLEI